MAWFDGKWELKMNGAVRGFLCIETKPATGLPPKRISFRKAGDSKDPCTDPSSWRRLAVFKRDGQEALGFCLPIRKKEHFFVVDLDKGADEFNGKFFKVKSFGKIGKIGEASTLDSGDDGSASGSHTGTTKVKSKAKRK